MVFSIKFAVQNGKNIVCVGNVGCIQYPSVFAFSMGYNIMLGICIRMLLTSFHLNCGKINAERHWKLV